MTVGLGSCIGREGSGDGTVLLGRLRAGYAHASMLHAPPIVWPETHLERFYGMYRLWVVSAYPASCASRMFPLVGRAEYALSA